MVQVCLKEWNKNSSAHPILIELLSCLMDDTAKKAASLLWDFYRDPLRSLTLLSLNVFSQNIVRWRSLALKSLRT